MVRSGAQNCRGERHRGQKLSAGQCRDIYPHRAEPVEQQPRVRCAFRSGDSTYYPRLSDVIWIQARRNYSHVYLCGSNFTVRELLSSIERRLEQYGFFRIQAIHGHHLEHVTEIRWSGAAATW